MDSDTPPNTPRRPLCDVHCPNQSSTVLEGTRNVTPPVFKLATTLEVSLVAKTARARWINILADKRNHRSIVLPSHFFGGPNNRCHSVKYKAHINIDWCSRTEALKYLFKYLTININVNPVMEVPVGLLVGNGVPEKRDDPARTMPVGNLGDTSASAKPNLENPRPNSTKKPKWSFKILKMKCMKMLRCFNSHSCA